jgi:hypothetical protein
MVLFRHSGLSLLQKSSLSFLMPAALAVASGNWMLAFAAALLTYTSVRYHAHSNPPPMWIIQLDPTLSRAYTCVYSTIAFVRWARSDYQETWYLVTVVASVGVVGLYTIELFTLYRNWIAYRTAEWMHVCVQQCACFAFISYLMGIRT